jgi:hypothetical protein
VFVKISLSALAVGLALSAGAAQAQLRPVSDVPYDAVSPAEAMAIVRSTGLRPLSAPFREGPYYVVHAMDSYGDTKRVVLDAEMGDVVRIRPLRGYARTAPWYGRRPTPPEFGGGPRLWRDEANRMGPPPGVIGRPWREPPPRYGVLDDDDDDLRPPRGVARPQLQGPPLPPTAGLPPPPDPVRPPPPAAGAPANPAPRTANVTPTNPPLPRERPATARSASTPRVILPGGPAPKEQAAPETTASIPAKPAAPAAPAASGIPPMMSYE